MLLWIWSQRSDQADYSFANLKNVFVSSVKCNPQFCAAKTWKPAHDLRFLLWRRVVVAPKYRRMVHSVCAKPKRDRMECMFDAPLIGGEHSDRQATPVLHTPPQPFIYAFVVFDLPRLPH